MKLIKIVLFLLYVITDIILLYIEIKLSVAVIVLLLILMSVSAAIHLFVHECGHLVGGLISGYKLVSLQIGPINITTDRSDKILFSLKHTRGGQCIMVPSDNAVLHYKAYNFGGIYANAFISVISSLLLLVDSFYATLFFVQLLFIGILKIIINLFPYMDHSVPNDGYIVELLKRDSTIQKDYVVYLSLYAALFWNENVCRDEYSYSRKPAKNDEDLLYYNGIQKLLESIR